MVHKDKYGRILILDSDKDSVQRLTETLGKEGYKVESINQPSRVIEKIKNDQIDVLLLGVEAQGIKGYDLVPIIKRINRFIPIIVISGDDSIEVATRFREQGVFFYALKPLDMKEIKVVVKNALDKRFKNTREVVWVEKEKIEKRDFEEDILDIEEAGKILKLSKTTISKLAKEGELPAGRIGNRWRFIRNQLFEWLRMTAAGNQKNYGTLILETMDEGVAVVDRKLRIVSCNGAYLQSLDIPRDRVIGEHCYRVSHRSMIPCPEPTCPARQAFKTEHPVKFMHINYDEEGKAHYCDVVALPMKDEQGKVSEVVEVIRDNTEIYNLNRHLNWVVGFVAHELKGTLGSVVMNISALADEKLSQTILENKRNEMLLAALSSLKLMHDMIRNYLISAKGKSAQLQFNITSVNLNNDILKPVLDELRPVLFKQGMIVETQIKGERLVHCDRDLMKIAIGNLINNAAKYGTPRTKIECTIIISEEKFEFNIFNQGIGIPFDKLTEIFNEFTRFDSSGIGGTGLGLYVVKMIADLHHGTVRAESGFIVAGKPITYEQFNTDEKFYELKEEKKTLERFARFILKIPDEDLGERAKGG